MLLGEKSEISLDVVNKLQSGKNAELASVMLSSYILQLFL